MVNKLYKKPLICDKKNLIAVSEKLQKVRIVSDDYKNVSEFVDENTLNVNIRRVRKRLEEIGVKDALETKRGMGYRLWVS